MTTNSKKTTFEDIEEATEERELLSLAYRCEGEAKTGLLAPEEYGKCMVLLAEKLGFGITPENLERAAQKYRE